MALPFPSPRSPDLVIAAGYALCLTRACRVEISQGVVVLLSVCLSVCRSRSLPAQSSGGGWKKPCLIGRLRGAELAEPSKGRARCDDGKRRRAVQEPRNEAKRLATVRCGFLWCDTYLSSLSRAAGGPGK